MGLMGWEEGEHDPEKNEWGRRGGEEKVRGVGEKAFLR